MGGVIHVRIVALLLKGVTYTSAQVLKKIVSFFRILETQNQEYKPGKRVFTKWSKKKQWLTQFVLKYKEWLAAAFQDI